LSVVVVFTDWWLRVKETVAPSIVDPFESMTIPVMWSGLDV